MTKEKFQSEIKTLERFFSIYCNDKHKDQKHYILTQTFVDETFELQSYLCQECKEILEDAFNNISLCPHEEKPRCRKCPNPCYEKSDWKQIAKVMRYSGIKLGLITIKKALRLA